MDKIVAEAEAEGRPLSDNERWMLRFSESDPDFVVDPRRVEQLEAQISDHDYEVKIAGLLRRAYQRDVEVDGSVQPLYREASATLRQGDHYLLVMIDQALGPLATGGAGKNVFRVLGQSGLFVLLVVPGSLAILMAGGIAAAAASPEGAQQPDELVAAALASLVLGGMGYYLIRLWRRERRNRRTAA